MSERKRLVKRLSQGQAFVARAFAPEEQVKVVEAALRTAWQAGLVSPGGGLSPPEVPAGSYRIVGKGQASSPYAAALAVVLLVEAALAEEAEKSSVPLSREDLDGIANLAEGGADEARTEEARENYEALCARFRRHLPLYAAAPEMLALLHRVEKGNDIGLNSAAFEIIQKVEG